MFDSILGHSRQIKLLSEDIRMDRLSHAYLFVGPEEVGKSTVAFSFIAQAIASHDYPCALASCGVCKSIRSGGGPQVLIFRDAGESMKVEQVRDLVQKLHLRASDGYLFCVMENIERMTPSAANAFLKVLEEPIDGTVFLLLSVHVRKVLPTLLSRVRQIRFSDVGEDILGTYLDRRGFSTVEVSNILRLSGGKVGFVMKLMENSEVLERYAQLYEVISHLFAKKDLVECFEFSDRISGSSDPRLISDVFRLMSLYLRSLGVEKHRHQLSVLSRAKHLFLNTNVNKRLLMEYSFLEMEDLYS